MKKIGITSILILSMVFILSGCVKFSKIGTEKYYIKIVKNGEKEKTTDSNNKVAYYYSYKEIPAYDSEGNKIFININTIKDKEFKKDAYLQVYVRNPSSKEINEVEGYEEVDSSKIPEKAKSELD